MSVLFIINTNRDIYLLLTNAVGSEEGAKQNSEVLAVPGAQGQCFLRSLPVLINTPLLPISFILDISSNPVSDGIQPSWVGRLAGSPS